MTGHSVALHLVIVSTVFVKCREEQRSHFCDVGAFIFSVWQATKQTNKIFANFPPQIVQFVSRILPLFSWILMIGKY